MVVSQSHPIQYTGQYSLERSKIAKVASRKSASMMEES
jgi:hypothetical protein